MENITEIITNNEGMIYKIINKYQNYFELEDLYQVAVIGIIKAYNNYHSTYNTKFTTYAYPYILGEVIKYINSFRSIKTNKNSKILYYKILKIKELLTQKLMKEPTTKEISIFMEIDESIITEIMIANMQVDSLDRIISEDDKNFRLYEKLGNYDYNIENYELHNELKKLSTEDRKIIIARYYENMSQKEIGKKLGMYQVEISRKEKKILERIKNNII